MKWKCFYIAKESVKMKRGPMEWDKMFETTYPIKC